MEKTSGPTEEEATRRWTQEPTLPQDPIDPTKNVLDLVRAESLRQDGLLAWSNKYQDGMRGAEKERQDSLAELRRSYEKSISDILTVQVKTTSELISTQLDKVTTNLAAQITTLTKASSDQIEVVNKSLGERITGLERFRWEVGGKTSVSDPAIAGAIAEMTGTVTNLAKRMDQNQGGDKANSNMIAIFIAVTSVVVSLVVGVFTVIVMYNGNHQQPAAVSSAAAPLSHASQ